MSYTYWSCEPYGRCYIGVRLCPKKYPTPELDIHYLGSYKDKSFKPRHKIILNVFDNHDDAIKEEIELHNAFDVVRNPHFANRAKQTSTGFSTAGTTPNEETRQRLSGVKNHNYGKQIPEETKQKMSEANSGEKNPNYGKPRSEYTKQKISESNKGQTRSEKARKKMSEAKRGKPAKNRNQEIWTRYDWIANLYISTGGVV